MRSILVKSFGRWWLVVENPQGSFSCNGHTASSPHAAADAALVHNSRTFYRFLHEARAAHPDAQVLWH
jgi:hypothetical protein